MYEFEPLEIERVANEDQIHKRLSRLGRMGMTAEEKQMIQKAPEQCDWTFKLTGTNLVSDRSFHLAVYSICNIFTRIIVDAQSEPRFKSVETQMTYNLRDLLEGRMSWVEAFTVFYEHDEPENIKKCLAKHHRKVIKAYTYNKVIDDIWDLNKLIRSFCVEILDIPGVLVRDFMFQLGQVAYINNDRKVSDLLADVHRATPLVGCRTAALDDFNPKKLTVLNRWYETGDLKLYPGERDPDGLDIFRQDTPAIPLSPFSTDEQQIEAEYVQAHKYDIWNDWFDVIIRSYDWGERRSAAIQKIETKINNSYSLDDTPAQATEKMRRFEFVLNPLKKISF